MYTTLGFRRQHPWSVHLRLLLRSQATSRSFNRPLFPEPKKEVFSRKDHFYQGKFAVGTYGWGDRRDGFFYGDVSPHPTSWERAPDANPDPLPGALATRQYPSNALERSQMSCGAFNEADVEEAFNFLEEHGLPMFDAREVRPPSRLDTCPSWLSAKPPDVVCFHVLPLLTRSDCDTLSLFRRRCAVVPV